MESENFRPAFLPIARKCNTNILLHLGFIVRLYVLLISIYTYREVPYGGQSQGKD